MLAKRGLSAYVTAVPAPPDYTAKPAFKPGLAIALRLLAVVCGGVLAVVVKMATERGASTLEIVFFRYLFALPFVTMWSLPRGGVSGVKSERLGSHFIRALLGMGAMLCVFMTVGALPLAESTTVLFTSPLIATVLSIVMLREPVGIHRWFAIALGIAGIADHRTARRQCGDQHGRRCARPVCGLPQRGDHDHHPPARRNGNRHGDDVLVHAVRHARHGARLAVFLSPA
ncbi:MAG: DMT family transporter [Alphaproteobacteria bacterium]